MHRFRRARLSFAAVVSVLLLAACGGDGEGGTDPDPTDAIASVSITPTGGQVALGATLQLAATVRNGRSEVVTASVTWTTSDAAIASIDGNGLVTAVAPGAVTITASAGGRSGTAGVEAFDPNPPASPGNVQATPLSNTEIEVTWVDNSNSETGHAILREEAGAAPTSASGSTEGGPAGAAVFVEVGTAGADATSFRDTGLAPGTTYRYRVEACNPVGCSEPTPAAGEPSTFPTLTIDTPDPLPDGLLGTAYQVDLASSGPAATWSLVDGGLPTGLALSGDGRIAGTPTDGGRFDLTVMAQGGGQMVTKPFGLTIVTPPAVTTTDLPDGVRGTAYSQSLEAQGGDGTYAWVLTAGALPPGITLGSTGLLSGTPTAAGSYAFTVQVTSAGLQASAQLSVDVFDPLQVATAVLSAGVQNMAYAETLQAQGGDGVYAWALLSGTLPEGLSLSAGGTISGTPPTLGTSNFAVEVTSGDGQTAQAALSITVNDQVVAPTVATTNLPDGGVGAVYSATLTATDGDGTYTWSVTAGALPGGLSLDGGTGAITGTPAAAGTASFTVQVSSAGLTGTADLSITVQPALGITTGTLPPGVEGVAYSATVGTSGGDGTPAFVVSSGTLPAGLTLDGGTGEISGTPAPTPAPPAPGPQAVGTSNFTIDVTNALGQSAQQALSIAIFLPLSVTTASLADGTVGASYSETLQATGGDGATTWSIASGSLPNGLVLGAGTGAITGTPTVAGTSNFTVQATSGDGQVATAGLSITVGTSPPVITTTTLPGGTVGVQYSQMVSASGGDGSYSWAIVGGALPDGLGIGAGTGTIGGTPTATGTFNFTVQVTSAGQTDTQALSITIAGGALSFARSHLPGGYIGVPYSGTPDPATGGSGGITYAITGGALPSGLSLNASSGEISGTPNTAGMAFFEMTATSGASSVSVIFGFTISTAAPGAFNIFGVNVADVIPSAAIQTAINAAFARYEAVITGDAPDLTLPGSGADASCGGEYPLFYGKTIDDVEVVMNIAPIDGPGNIAGQAGICGFIRGAAPLTATAQLTLDDADVGGLSAPLKFALVFHELGHGLGIGEGVWTFLGLMTGEDGPTPEYVGALGVGEFQTTLGQTGNPPIEADFGDGTRDSHWDEGYFDGEMMTGFLDNTGNAISTMTVGAFGDLGWGGIVLGAADAYSVPGCSPSCVPPAPAPGAPVFESKIPLLDDVIGEPLFVVDPDGTVRMLPWGGGGR